MKHSVPEATIEAVTKTIVKIKNLPMRGTSSEVGGINFEMSSKNTVRASKTEIQRDIFSPDSEGRTNTKIARLEHFKLRNSVKIAENYLT